MLVLFLKDKAHPDIDRADNESAGVSSRRALTEITVAEMMTVVNNDASVMKKSLLCKSHPVQQAMSTDRKPADLVDGKVRRNPGEPSPEQAKDNDYKKPRVTWRGLTIAIENPAGSVRRGKGWEVRMKFDYGEVVGSMGVDGDPVDIYLGPNLDDAPMVYVVHQRKNKDWEKYDEDKVMAGFMTEEDARQAFLSNYTDPRFLGPITAMPVDEFISKVSATKEKPAMIKALFLKTHVDSYTKKDGTFIAAHEDRRAAAQRLADKIRAHGPEFEPHIEEASGGSIYVTAHRHELTASGKRHAKKVPQPMKYKARFADHGSYWGSTISVDPVTGNSEDDAFAMFEHAADPKSKPRISTFNRSSIDPRDRTQYVARVNYNENVHKNGGRDYWREEPRQRAADLTKSAPTVILFFKAHVGPYLRRGKLVNLAGYQGKQARAVASAGQMDMFGEHPTDSAHASGGNWQMPIKDAIKEHKELIQAAKTPGKADDRREVWKQKEELARMKDAQSNWEEQFPIHARSETIWTIVLPIRNQLREMADSAESDEDEKIFKKLNSKIVGAATGDLSSMRAVEKAVKMRKFAKLKSDLIAVLRNGAPNLMGQAKEAAEMISALNGGRSFNVSPEVKEMYDKWADKADDKKQVEKQREELGRMEAASAYNAAVTSTKTGPDDDNPRRKYYVTIAREGKGVSKLAGPFDTHDEAKAHVGRAREESYKIDPRTHFDSFGTAGVEADEHKPGVLNERLGIKRKQLLSS